MRVERLGVAAQFLGQAHGDAGHAVAVAAGVRVLGVDGRGQRPDDARQQLRLLPVELDVAAVDAEDRGDRAEQAGLDRAELAVVDVVERRQPAEEVLAFGQRHGDHLPDLRARPVGLAGDRPVDHDRPAAAARRPGARSARRTAPSSIGQSPCVSSTGCAAGGVARATSCRLSAGSN